MMKVENYKAVRNFCVASGISLILLFSANRDVDYVDIGDNLYECEFVLSEGNIMLIRPIGSKNYYDIIRGEYYPIEDIVFKPMASLVSFLSEEQIDAVLNYDISYEEIIGVFYYVCEEYGDLWINQEVDYSNVSKISNTKNNVRLLQKKN